MLFFSSSNKELLVSIYIGVLSFLAGLCALHFFLYKLLNNEKSQFFILGVCVCYGLITILKRMVFGTIISEFVAQLITFPLITVTFILISIYVAVLFNRPSYYKQSWIFYLTMVIIFFVGIVLYAINNSINFYYYGLAILSLQYVAFSLYCLVKLWKQVAKTTKILLFATYIMIISFVVLALMTIFEIKQVYFCAVGPFIYIFVAEWVSFSQISKNRNSEIVLTEQEVKIVNLLKQQDLEIKEISSQMGLSVETTRKYLKNIYKKYDVHSKKQLVNQIKD